jgi:hypothetical protein
MRLEHLDLLSSLDRWNMGMVGSMCSSTAGSNRSVQQVLELLRELALYLELECLLLVE